MKKFLLAILLLPSCIVNAQILEPSGGGADTTKQFNLVPINKAISYIAVPSDLVLVSLKNQDVSITLPNDPADKSIVGIKIVFNDTVRSCKVNTYTVNQYLDSVGNRLITMSVYGQINLLQYQKSNKLWISILNPSLLAGGVITDAALDVALTIKSKDTLSIHSVLLLKDKKGNDLVNFDNWGGVTLNSFLNAQSGLSGDALKINAKLGDAAIFLNSSGTSGNNYYPEIDLGFEGVRKQYIAGTYQDLIFGTNGGFYYNNSSTGFHVLTKDYSDNWIFGSNIFLNATARVSIQGQDSLSSSNAFDVRNSKAIPETLFIIKCNGTISMPRLPTTSAGLVSGDIWNNLGILTIVP